MKTGATTTCWTMGTARTVIMAPRFFRMREKTDILVELYISGLRRKIDAEFPTKLIHTLRGHGYVLRSGTVSSIPHPGAVSWPLRHLANRYALHLSLFVLTGSPSSSCFDIGITSLQSSTKAGLFTNTRSCSGF